MPGLMSNLFDPGEETQGVMQDSSDADAALDLAVAIGVEASLEGTSHNLDGSTGEHLDRPAWLTDVM